MSQATQSLPLKHQLSAHRLLAVSALLALLAATAVVLVLTISGGSTQTSAAAFRSDGGPEESATAASVGSRTSPGPDESSIAASTGSGAAPSATGVNTQARTWPAYPVEDPSMTPAEGPTPYGGHR